MTKDTSSFQGKVAIITGGTQGIGEATARLFAERDAAGLVICGRNNERGQAVAADLSAGGCKTHFLRIHLENIAECRAAVAAADERFGKVDALVNAAAASERGSIWNTTPELWDEIMAVNVRGPFLLMQEAVKLMRREGIPGSIVNVVSVAANGGPAFLTPYAASKGALATLTLNVAYAVLRHRIRVNGINFGWMDTPGEDAIQRKFHSDGADWLEEAEAAQPFGRLIKPPDAARAIAFLASDESGLMTGSVFHYDQSVIGAGGVPQPTIGEMGTE
ncbi:MAG: SDR family oxidoreductase [Chloroflexi bacterium]|nr:SDR family oxidoreductase [Chloroflexota bacterium]